MHKIKAGGMRAGVSLRPGTPIEDVFPLVGILTSISHSINLPDMGELPISTPFSLRLYSNIFEDQTLGLE